MKNENKTKIRRSDVVVSCMDGDICGFAIPEYIERQKSCCRRAEKFCRISEFGVDAALRRRGAAKNDSGAEMIRKIREAFFREMNVFNKRKCKKYRQFLPRRQKLSVFICAFVRTIQAETVPW